MHTDIKNLEPLKVFKPLWLNYMIIGSNLA